MDLLNYIEVGLAGGLLIVGLFAGLQRGTILNLRETVSDLRGRRDDLEKDRQDLTAERERERKAASEKIAELQGAVRVLSDTVTGKEAIAELQERLDVHHQESMAVLTSIKDGLAKRGGS